jgi:hypothetical protein
MLSIFLLERRLRATGSSFHKEIKMIYIRAKTQSRKKEDCFLPPVHSTH